MVKAKDIHHVGFFVSSDSWINHQQWHYQVSKALYDRGYRVSVITSRKRRLYAKSRRYGVPVQPYRKGTFLLQSIMHLVRILKHAHISILFINHPKDLRNASIAAWLAGVDKVMYRRGTVSHINNNLINRRILNRLISRVITNSDANKEIMTRDERTLYDPNKVEVIYHGVDINGFDQKSLLLHNFRKNGEMVVGMLAGHFSKARFLQLVSLIQRDKQKLHQYRFIVYGSRSHKDRLLRRLKAKCINGELVCWDTRSNTLLDFMHSIDVFFSENHHHYFNYPILYAMALQKPVIGIDQGSIPEMIQDYTNGFLIRTDNIQAVREKLQVLTDPDLRFNMGQESRKMVHRKFNFEHAIDRIEQLIGS